MRDITKGQIGDEIMDEAEAYWKLKEGQGLPEEFKQAVKFAFIKGWTKAEKKYK